MLNFTAGQPTGGELLGHRRLVFKRLCNQTKEVVMTTVAVPEEATQPRHDAYRALLTRCKSLHPVPARDRTHIDEVERIP